MKYMDKSSIQADLKLNVAEVIFTKVDGTVRKMRATLSKEYLPKDVNEERYEVDFEKDDNPNVVKVWDIDNKGWRSFRVDKVISMQHVNTV
jgi:hypothetical protein